MPAAIALRELVRDENPFARGLLAVFGDEVSGDSESKDGGGTASVMSDGDVPSDLDAPFVGVLSEGTAKMSTPLSIRCDEASAVAMRSCASSCSSFESWLIADGLYKLVT